MAALTYIWKFLNSKLFLAVLSGLFVVFSGTLLNWINTLKEEKEQLKDELTVKTTEVVRYKNDLGQEVTKTIEYVQTIEQLECSQDSLEQVVYKTIKASNLKERQLKDAMVVNLESSLVGVYDSIRYIYDTIPVEKDIMSMLSPVEIKQIPIKYYNDGFLKAEIYPDSLSYTYNEQIVLIGAKQRVDRKFALWRFIGWKKIVDRGMVEMSSNNPNSKLNGRKIKIN